MAIEKVTIPDFGEVQQITVVEVYIQPGATVAVEDPLIALESEKAVMDIPAPCEGTVKEVALKAGDVVTSGDLIALVETAGEAQSGDDSASEKEEASQSAPQTKAAQSDDASSSAADGSSEQAATEQADVTASGEPGRGGHATPSIRAFAREKGVALDGLPGSGPHGRILKEDVLAALESGQAGASAASAKPAAAGGAAPAPAEPPLEDFSKYGQIEEVELGRIPRISGPHLQRSWQIIPHVTHFEEADITELEAFRKKLNSERREDQVRFSPLIFVIKVTAATLAAFPHLNSSLVPGGQKLVLKKYCHMGIAVDTKDGLVVPVIKDVDRKGMADIADDLQRLSSNARAGKLGIGDLQGGSFTISSLGGIGGTGFTPIVNWPQVGILGLSRSTMKPVWDGEQFVPRLMLPFSLSYDHRVIDGAEAARFCRALKTNLEDLKRTLL